MIRRLTLIAIACCGILGHCTLTHAQSGRQLNWAEKTLSDLNVDFGTVARGADTRHILKVTNLYEEDIYIVDVGTTCGCTAATPNKKLLKTDEVAEIEIVMNTVKFTHRKDSNVDVTLQFRGTQGRADTQRIRVPITAFIRTDVVLTPGNADFGTVEFNQGAERKIQISYAGRDDWKIQEVKVGHDDLSAQLKEVRRGGGRVDYELNLKLDAAAKLGEFQDRIVLKTDDRDSPEVPVLVTGRVAPDIEIVPGRYELGNLNPSQEKEFSVVVKGNRPFIIEGIECEEHADCFEFKPVPEVPKTVHVVRFRMTAPAEPGEFAETFTVSVAGRELPLKFHADGTIVSGT